MRIKFISLKEPLKYGYSYDSESFETRTTFNDHFRQCETYGDVHENGNYTQHSPDWAVQVDFIADYLASIATYILAHPGEETNELLCQLGYAIQRRPSVEEIEFAASVKFKPISDEAQWEKKRRYFAVKEMKVTSDSQKEYDTRYKRVDTWCDGSADALYRMLIPEHANFMMFYSYAEAIRDWCQSGDTSKKPYFYGMAAQFLKWFNEDSQKARDLRYAYKALDSLINAYQQRCEAEMHLCNLHWPPAPVEKTEETNAA